MNKERIEIAKRSEINGTFIELDGFYPQKYFKKGSFDAVFMMNTIWPRINHIYDEELESILSNNKSIIKPEGYLLISWNNAYCIFKVPPNEVILESKSPNIEGLQYNLQKLLRAIGANKI